MESWPAGSIIKSKSTGCVYIVLEPIDESIRAKQAIALTTNDIDKFAKSKKVVIYCATFTFQRLQERMNNV